MLLSKLVRSNLEEVAAIPLYLAIQGFYLKACKLLQRTSYGGRLLGVCMLARTRLGSVEHKRLLKATLLRFISGSLLLRLQSTTRTL